MSVTPETPAVESSAPPAFDRSWPLRVWYEAVRVVTLVLFALTGSFRASGVGHMPESGGVLLVSNPPQLSRRLRAGHPVAAAGSLNYVAFGPSLFVPLLGAFIRSVGGFPIQREGMKRVGRPEGDPPPPQARGGRHPLPRRDAEPRRPGRPAQAGDRGPGEEGARAGRPRRDRRDVRGVAPRPPLPRARTRSGSCTARRILPAELSGLSPEAVTELLHARIVDCHRAALAGLARDLNVVPPDA